MHATDILHTERLILQPTTLADVDALWPHMSNPDISRHMSWEPHATKEETLAFVTSVEKARSEGRSYTWTLRSKTDHELCGIFSIIGILRRHRSLIYDRGELAYWCAPAWQSKGIMTEAGRAVIQHAFGPLGLNRLLVGHHFGNPASQRLIERLGFSVIGTEHQAFEKHGRWIDIIMYELLKSGWQKPQPNSIT